MKHERICDLSDMDIPEHLQTLLRRLTICEEGVLDLALHGDSLAGLDQKTSALVTIAALVATDAEGPSYQVAIDHARLNGASDEEVLATLIAVAPLVGSARIAAAIPEVDTALGS
jgi:alkylhydroperoxidase/carboxymuconolactone decarboxylase family protein YurZ